MSRRFGGLMASLSRNGNNKFPVSFATVLNKSYLLLGVFLKRRPLDEVNIFDKFLYVIKKESLRTVGR